MKKIIYTITGIIICFQLIAQEQEILNKEETGTYNISYSNSGPLYQNQILKSIGEVSGNGTNSSVNVSYKIRKKIVQSGNQHYLRVYLETLDIDGDTDYKGFSLKEELIPKKMALTFGYKVNGQVVETFNFNELNANVSSTPAAEKVVNIPVPTVDISNSQEYGLKVDNIAFTFDITNKTAYDEKVVLIEKYYTSAEKIEDELTTIDEIVIDEDVLSNMEDIEKIYDYKTLATNDIQLVKNIKNETFYTSLKVSSNDPEKMNENMELLKTKSSKLLTVSNNIIDKLDEIYYEKGIDELNKNNVQMAQFYFDKSITNNDKYAPAHYQIAKINYDNDNFDGSLAIIYNIYNMNPDVQTINSTNDLAELIFIEYLGKASSYNSKSQYDNALNWCNEAKIICNKVSAVSCSQNLENEYKTAYNGKYSEYLFVVDKAITSGILSNAEAQLKVASEYQKTYGTYITSNAEIVSRHTTIYEGYIANGLNYYKNKDYSNSIDQYLNAQRICNSVSYLECTNELTTGLFNARTGYYTAIVDNAELDYKNGDLDDAESNIETANNYQVVYSLVKDSRIDKLVINIKQKRYDTYIADAIEDKEEQDYTSALDLYVLAQNIEINYEIIPDSKLKIYINETAKLLTIQKLEEGEKKVNVNDLTSAREYYKEAVGIQTTYDLSSDEEVKAAVKSLNEKIFQQQCLNYQAEYDKYYQNAITNIFNKDYIKADELLSDAVAVVGNHPECMLEGANAEYKIIEIADAVAYQQMLKDADIALSNKKYQDAIDKYIEAGDFYSSNSIYKSYSLDYESLYTYIEAGSSEFINYGVDYYTGTEELDNAVLLLKSLNTRMYNKKYTKENQKALAIKLAVRDFDKDPSAEPKQNVLDYTGTDSWFKYFKKEYLKQWKKLK